MICSPLFITISIATTLLSLSEALVYWEPCKIQCDKNYAENDINQLSLISVCHRGCDMFTFALISTPQPENFDETEELQGPKALPQIELQREMEETIENEIVKNSLQSSNKASTRTPPPSTPDEHLQPCAEHNHYSKGILHPNVQESSKTTVEPASQPVQDHPVEANEHSTTTNGPKRTQLESMKKDILKEFEKDHPNAISIRFVETKFNIIHDQVQNPQKLNGPNDFENVGAANVNRWELAKHSCRHACVTAYGGAAEQEACVVGCHLQATATVPNDRPSNAIMPEESSYRNPLRMVQKMFFSFAGQVSHLVRMSSSWYSSSTNQQSDENIQVYGGADLTPRAQVSFFEGLKPRLYLMDPAEKKPTETLKPGMYHALKVFKTDFFRFPRPLSHSITLKNSRIPPEVVFGIFKKEQLHKDQEYRGQHYSGHSANRINHLKDSKEHTMDDPKIHEREQLNHNSHQQIQQQLDLLECISRKSGLPRWFIATTIFASALVVLWLCFSLTAPPEDIRVIKTNVKPPESERLDDDDDYDDLGGYSEKKTLLSRDDDVIKIRIENV